MSFFRWLIGKKVRIFALFKTVVESIVFPKPSPVGEGAEPARRMRCPCALNNPSVTASRATADCQASATPKNASKGERHPKHFLGLKLIDKTILCKSSLLKV